MTSNEDFARGLATEVRERLGLGQGPIKDVFEFAHLIDDVDVQSAGAGEAEHGLSGRDRRTGRIAIVVATTDHPMRQRSTVAHELGHALGGDLESGAELVPGERSVEEIRADAFARHLLLPLEAVRHNLSSDKEVTLDDLSALVQEYGVSPHIAAIQLRTGGLITKPTCDDWSSYSARQLATRYGWLSQYDAMAADSARPRAPQRLMTRAVEGYRQNVLGLVELARWYRVATDALAEQVGPPNPPTDEPADDEFGDDWGFDSDAFTTDTTPAE